eukprot:gene11057-23113_t
MASLILWNILPKVESKIGVDFDEYLFRRKLGDSIDRVRQILDTNKHPKYAIDIQHVYEDKYILSEYLTNTMMASHLNSLKRIGLTTKGLNATLEWQTSNRPIFLRFKAEEQCTFLRMDEREVDSNSKLVTKLQTDQGSSMWTSKVAAKVKEYYWKFDVKYDLIAFYGIDDQISDRVVLATKTASHEVKTSTESNPYTSSTVIDPIDVDLTWFLSHINPSNLSLNFNINRNNSKCFTPYRNPDVEAALKHSSEIGIWSRRVNAYLTGHLFPVQSGHDLDLNALSTSTIFQPILPLFMDNSDNQTSSSVILDSSDVNKLLYEQMRSMQEKFDVLSK